jgi:tRNA1(Val) A37 N6-methylase TrmN6
MKTVNNINFNSTPTHYNIDTNNLLLTVNGENYKTLPHDELNLLYDKCADELVKLVDDGEIWFPFQKFFQKSPEVLFNNLLSIDIPVTTPTTYRLHSYYPEYASYLPPKFRGTPTIISSSLKTYLDADVLSDHFIEHIRLKAKRYDQEKSVLESWLDPKCLKSLMLAAVKKPVITPATLRDTLYEKIAETKVFNPSWAKKLITLVLGSNISKKRWLDISVGWGDRLLTAMALDMEYVGYDPNTELIEGHSKMIEMFGSSQRHKVIYEPFENAELKPASFDVVLTSPPYFTTEEYVANQEGQSIVSYSNYNEWMARFMFVSLMKAWSALVEGGYLILHLGDTHSTKLCEATNIFIENNLIGASWEGIIGLQGKSGYPRPTWVWKKLSPSAERQVWESESRVQSGPGYNTNRYNRGALLFKDRTLYNTYPDLNKELINYYASCYSPNFYNKKKTCHHVIEKTAKSFPSISRDDICQVLNDNLLINSLLEDIGMEATLNWAKAMILITFPQ